MFAGHKYGRSALAALVAVVSACTSIGTAASLRLYSPTPEVTVVQESSAIPRLSIRLKNEGVDAAAMVVWSVAVAVVPEPGASGSVKLSAPFVPADYVLKDYSPFGMMLGPDAPPVPSGSYADLTLVEGGAAIPPASNGGLFDVDLIVSSDAVGKFSVIVKPFDVNVLIGSSWSDYGDIMSQLPFVNVTPEECVMAVIDVQATPEPAGGALIVSAAIGLLSTSRRRVR